MDEVLVLETRKTYAKMRDIAAIVDENPTDGALLAQMLRSYAEETGTDVAWVAKKAHEAIRDMTWRRYNEPLNVALGLPKDYVG